MRYKAMSNYWSGGKLLIKKGDIVTDEAMLKKLGINVSESKSEPVITPEVVDGGYMKKGSQMVKSDEREETGVKVCLNVGCGSKIKKSDENERWFNLDIRKLTGVDFTVDIRTIAFGGLDVIEARDILEHFGRRESREILGKLVSWLDGGGKIIIQCPDIKEIWSDLSESEEWSERRTFGGQDYTGNYHGCGWTIGMMERELNKLGVDVVKKSNLAKNGKRQGNFYMEGIKRGKDIDVGLITIAGKRWANMGMAYLSDCVYWLGGLCEVLGKRVSTVKCGIEEGGYTKKGNLASDGIYVADWEVMGSVDGFLRLILDRKIKVCFIWECRFNIEILKRIRDKCECMVIVTNDYQAIRDRDKHFGEVAKLVDYVITTQSNAEYGGKEKNICIRQGVNWENYREDHKKINKVAFIGNLRSEERRDYLETLAKRVDGIDIYSQDYAKMGNWSKHIKMHPAIDRVKMRQVCGETKIIIGDKFEMRADFKSGAEHYWSNRIYQILGSGGFYLTPYIEGLEEEFENGKHIVWVKSMDEMVDKVKYYSRYNAKREKIAKAGYDLAHKKYKYVDRVRCLVNELRQRGVNI